MTAPATPLDIVTVSIALATWVVGAEVAQIVGPYSVIIAGAIGGGASESFRINYLRAGPL